MFQVRTATQQDIVPAEEPSAHAFAELHNTYVPSADVRASAAADASGFSRLVALAADGSVVGTLLCRAECDRLHIRALAVHRAHRRQGVARALLDHVAQLAASRALRAVSLFTILQSDNVPIFERLGFGVIGQTEEPTTRLVEGGRATAVYMERIVAEGAKP